MTEGLLTAALGARRESGRSALARLRCRSEGNAGQPKRHAPGDGPPRACIFTTHPVLDQRIRQRQIGSLTKQGYRVTLLATGQDPHAPQPGVTVRTFNRGTKTLPARVYLIARLTLTALRTPADIYHFHDPELLPIGVALRVLRRRPVVYDVHEYYRLAWREKVMSPAGKRLVHVLTGMYEDLFAHLVGNVSAVSPRMARHFGLLGCQVATTPNYAPRERFPPIQISELEWERRRGFVLHTGTLDESRGSLIIPAIAKEAKALRPELTFLVVRRFFSRIDEHAMCAALASHEASGDADLLTFIPSVLPGDLPQLLRRAMVGLSPVQPVSQHPLTIATKWTEFMSQSVPIVASDFAVSRHYIRDQGCGTVVAATDPKAFAQAIVSLYDDLSAARQMGEAGRRLFIAKLAWEATAEPALLRLYADLLRGGRSGPPRATRRRALRRIGSNALRPDSNFGLSSAP